MKSPRPRIAPVVWQPPAVPRRSSQPHGTMPMPRPALHALPGRGPEDVVVDADGRVVAGLEDGRIVRMAPADGSVETLADTGGRPLGVEVDADGLLVVCDADRGLLRIDPATGTVSELVGSSELIDGRPLRVCNNAAIARDGTIWFSDSSARFALKHWKGDLLEHSGTGRLLRRDPDGRVEVMLTGLHFANGVALAADGSYVAVAETGACRLQRVWLTGERAGHSEVFVDGLSGYPDNIALGSDGLVWVALPSPRTALLTGIQRLPAGVRALASRVPERMQPRPAPTVSVVAVDDTGRIVREIRGEIAGFRMLTAVREAGGVLWFGSLEGDSVATLRPAQSAGAVP